MRARGGGARLMEHLVGILIATWDLWLEMGIYLVFGFTVAGFGVQLMKRWLLPGPHDFKDKILGRLISVVCPDLSLFNLSSPAGRGVEIPAEVNYGMSTYVHEGKQYLMLQTGSKLTAMALSDF